MSLIFRTTSPAWAFSIELEPSMSLTEIWSLFWKLFVYGFKSLFFCSSLNLELLVNCAWPYQSSFKVHLKNFYVWAHLWARASEPEPKLVPALQRMRPLEKSASVQVAAKLWRMMSLKKKICRPGVEEKFWTFFCRRRLKPGCGSGSLEKWLLSWTKWKQNGRQCCRWIINELVFLRHCKNSASQIKWNE